MHTGNQLFILSIQQNQFCTKDKFKPTPLNQSQEVRDADQTSKIPQYQRDGLAHKQVF